MLRLSKTKWRAFKPMGINPLETTHFKAGFLGIAPSFHSESVYRSGMHAQYDYQRKRFKQMMKNPAFFNSSLFDTLSGEYWRSIHKKQTISTSLIITLGMRPKSIILYLVMVGKRLWIQNQLGELVMGRPLFTIMYMAKWQVSVNMTPFVAIKLGLDR